MSRRAYRIVNVFTRGGARLSGNPLAVFEDGSGLDFVQMLAIARQFNLSETTFVLPSAKASAAVRIFTPTIEMPFAGHPTLGTAHVVRELAGGGASALTLEMAAGVVEVQADGDRYTLRTARAPTTRPFEAGREAIAAALGLDVVAIAADPLWVDTGAEQLVVPLVSAASVRAAKPIASLIDRHAFNALRGEAMAYVFAEGGDKIVARFFFTAHGGLVEDPATGSACANLGGYLLATNRPRPVGFDVEQGDAVARPSDLRLDVDAAGQVFVGGHVVELGRGEILI